MQRPCAMMDLLCVLCLSGGTWPRTRLPKLLSQLNNDCVQLCKDASGNFEAKVADFGLAQIARSAHATASVKGAPAVRPFMVLG